MSYDALFDRRAFMVVTGAAAVAAALPASAAPSVAAQSAALLIAVEEAGDISAIVAAVGAPVVTLMRADDPVRFWRREVAPRLEAGGALAGVTLWSDYLVFRGLAAEAGLKLKAEARAEGAVPLIAWRFG
jgi:hypothetical protein